MKVRLNLKEVYAWWAEQIGKEVDEFDQYDKDAAVSAYMERLDEYRRSNQVRRTPPRRRDWR